MKQITSFVKLPRVRAALCVGTSCSVLLAPFGHHAQLRVFSAPLLPEFATDMPIVLLELVGIPDTKEYAAVVTLNRPQAKNALNKELSLKLASTLGHLRSRDDIRVCILIGAGHCFCAGVDLRDPIFADAKMMTAEGFIGPGNSLWQLRHAKFPVIAAVAGPCITGGFELALNCDFIMASKSAFFQDTHGKYGIVPGGGMASILPRSIGLHAAKWMSMTCQRVTAERAYQLGLVAELVDSDDALKDTALTAATRICGHNQRTVRQIKQMQHTALQYDVDRGLEYEARVAIEAYKNMAKDPSGTRSSLASKFAARSKL